MDLFLIGKTGRFKTLGFIPLMKEGKRRTVDVTGGWESQPAKRNQTPNLNPAQNTGPTSRPVHALLGGYRVFAYDDLVYKGNLIGSDGILPSSIGLIS